MQLVYLYAVNGLIELPGRSPDADFMDRCRIKSHRRTYWPITFGKCWPLQEARVDA
jgi:hypothetical protein